MAKTLTLFTTTEERDMPAPGRDFGTFRFRLIAQSGNEAKIDTTEVRVEFPGVTEGASYTAILEEYDTAGVLIREVTRVEILVPAAPSKYMGAVGLSWSVA